MKTLKRKHARCVMILLLLTLLFAFLPWLMYDLLGMESLAWGVLGEAVCFLVMIWMRMKFLRCPYCGKSEARPYLESRRSS